MALPPRESPLFKLVMCGEADVGKSTMMNKLTDSSLPSNYNNTTGMAFKTKTLPLKDKTVTLQIWDWTSSKREVLKSLTASYYGGVHGVVIVYDITRKETFQRLLHCIQEVQHYTPKSVVKILVGNKCDLVNERQVKYETAKDFSVEVGIDLFETSAESEINLDQTLFTLVSQIHKQ